MRMTSIITNRRMRRLCGLAILGLIVWSCADKTSVENLDFLDAGVERAPRNDVVIASTDGCAVDADCGAGRYCFLEECAFECTADEDCAEGSFCDARGRCIGEDEAPDKTDIRTDRIVVKRPVPLQTVRAGKNSVDVTLELNDPVGKAGLAYTVSRSDMPWDGLVKRAFGDRVVTFSIPAGAADPSLPAPERSNVDVTLHTGVGTFKVGLLPGSPTAGMYVGKVTINRFGAAGLPIEMGIATKPEGVRLEDAVEAYLVLKVSDENLFSPINAFKSAPSYMAAKLEYDAFVDRYVAVFDYEYRLQKDAVLYPDKVGQIGRIMRFEIETTDGPGIIGRMADRWEGLYDALSADGVVELVDVVFEGDLELTRTGSFLDVDDLPAPPDVDPATPTLLKLPPLDACVGTNDAFDEAPVEVEGKTYACTVHDVQSFTDASIEGQVSCAVAAATHALSQETTGQMIADFLDDTVDNPGGMSFSDFMEKCANNEDGVCLPSPAVRCARQLTAYASRRETYESEDAALLVSLHQETAQEEFLGRQLAAFKNDADTRLKWLATSDYPAVVTSAVKNKIADLLEDWQTRVLEVHLAVLAGFMDPSGIAVLSRSTKEKASADVRARLLMDMVQSWRGTMDALVLATTRWDLLFQEATPREEKADYVSSRMRDLYLTAGVLTNLARGLSTGYMATAFGAGFSELMKRLSSLSMSFDARVFARDAEVVVSTSLNPEDSNTNKLTALRTDAEDALAKAREVVAATLESSREEALNETELRNRMNNEIENLRTVLVSMCGLPSGCTLEDLRSDRTCAVRTAPGECGLNIQKDDGTYTDLSGSDLNASEAGRSVLNIQEAALNVRIARAELDAFEQRAALELSTLEAFSKDVIAWNEARLNGVTELEQQFDDVNAVGAQGMAELEASIRSKTRIRADQIRQTARNIEQWNQIRMSGVTTDFTAAMATSVIHFGSSTLRDTGDFTVGMGEAVAEGCTADGGPKVPALISGQVGGLVLKTAANALDLVGDGIENGSELVKALREAKLENMKEEAELDGAISEADIQQIEDALALNDAKRQDVVDGLRQLYDLAKEQRAAELAYAADMDELRERRTAFLKMLLERAELELKLERSLLGLEQRTKEYLGVTERAALEEARLEDLDAQRSNVNQLIGSPGGIFARANQLAEAESALQRAKDRMLDWLVGLEYYAVRPFIDQRVQILLAVNAYQLEEIFAKLDEIESRCGGGVNTDHAVISVRDDLLRATLPVFDVAAEKGISKKEHFLQILEAGLVSVDKRIRYRSDAVVGDLLQRKGRVLAGTFDVSLDDFANLSATCNAKVVSVAVQLVGDLGEGNPIVTILYDGTSRLRSCQPDIEEYIDLVGPELTSFGETTLLRTPGRAISPLAGINEWRDETAANITLGGLPLASQYTVLIDETASDNAKLDWSKLEDILFDVTYAYSDVFSAGRCE